MKKEPWLLVAGLVLLAGCNRQGFSEPASTAAGTASSAPAVEQVVVTGSEFAFSPAEIRIDADVPSAVKFVNEGQVEHDWTVFDASGVPVMGMHAHAPAGELATVLLDLEPGRYQVWCTIPGHREAGMTGGVTVR